MKGLWSAMSPDGKTHVRLEKDEDEKWWITVEFPGLGWGPGRLISASVQVTEEDLTRLSFVLTAQQ
jgi:hypothetical protein